LLAYAAYSVYAAMLVPSWLAGFGILTAVAGLLGMALRARWTVLVLVLIYLRLLGEWLLSIWLSFRIGYFSHAPLGRALTGLLPGVLLISLAGYSCLVAWRYIGKTRG
jgi:hypothetical protein